MSIVECHEGHFITAFFKTTTIWFYLRSWSREQCQAWVLFAVVDLQSKQMLFSYSQFVATIA